MFSFLPERRAEEEQESERAEREALLSAIEEHKRLETENEERIKNRNLSYQRDLDMQIDYQRSVKSKEMDEEEREFRLGQVSKISPQHVHSCCCRIPKFHFESSLKYTCNTSEEYTSEKFLFE